MDKYRTKAVTQDFCLRRPRLWSGIDNRLAGSSLVRVAIDDASRADNQVRHASQQHRPQLQISTIGPPLQLGLLFLCRQNNRRDRFCCLNALEALSWNIQPRRLGAFFFGDRSGLAVLHVGRLGRCRREKNRLGYESREGGDLDQHGSEGDLFEHPRERRDKPQVPYRSRRFRASNTLVSDPRHR